MAKIKIKPSKPLGLKFYQWRVREMKIISRIDRKKKEDNRNEINYPTDINETGRVWRF